MSELTQTRHYDYVPIIDRDPLVLPDKARVAVVPYINIEHFPADIPGTAIIKVSTPRPFTCCNPEWPGG